MNNHEQALTFFAYIKKIPKPIRFAAMAVSMPFICAALFVTICAAFLIRSYREYE